MKARVEREVSIVAGNRYTVNENSNKSYQNRKLRQCSKSSMFWNGVEYFQRWTKLDLENIDNIVLCQQKKRFTVNLLKKREREKNITFIRVVPCRLLNIPSLPITTHLFNVYTASGNKQVFYVGKKFRHICGALIGFKFLAFNFHEFAR